MKRRKAVFSVCMLLFLAVCLQVHGEESRLALVIGNSNYSSSPLRNPANDARAMARALEQLHFKVITIFNGTHRQMKDAIDQFINRLHSYDVGLFYYSGHGVQYEGANYLVPVGADIQQAPDIQFEAVPAEEVLNDMGSAGTKVKVIILDACRNNPFTNKFRSIQRGLSVIQNTPADSLIVYSTAPGQEADDGNGVNSPFTAALLRYMTSSGEDVESMLRVVRSEVMKATNDRQVPWASSSLTASFYFAGSANRVRPAPEIATVLPKIYAATWGGLSVSGDNGASWRTYTTTNGLGDNNILGVYASGSTICAGTFKGGLSVSTDGGASWKTYTTANGLGANMVFCVYSSGSTIYAGTWGGGLSVSTDRGASWRTYSTANGLGTNYVQSVYAVGSTIYAATPDAGLSISADGGASWETYTTANGLGSNRVFRVYATESTIYAAAQGGLSVSTDGGASWRTYTMANGLGSNDVFGVCASESTIYAATIDIIDGQPGKYGPGGGLSVSTDGGASWKTYTTANGLRSNVVGKVYAFGSIICAALDSGLSVSTDGGASWKTYTTANGLSNNGIGDVCVSPPAGSD